MQQKQKKEVFPFLTMPFRQPCNYLTQPYAGSVEAPDTKDIQLGPML
jgi:hypothetical protein